MGILDSITGWRSGAVSGLNMTQNSVTMTVAIVAPFLAMWVGIKMFLPEAMYDTAVSVSVFGWLAWLFVLYAWAKADAGDYIVFPQSKWRFPDGTCRTFDLKIPPDSWERICEFADGSVGYKVYFDAIYAYQDPDLPFMTVFNVAYWILPALWDIAFARRAYGEFFHKGVFVNSPSCEDISVYVTGFEEKEGEMFPICMINDCTQTYRTLLKEHSLPIDKRYKSTDHKGYGFYTLWRDSRKRESKMGIHTAYVEESAEVAIKDSSLNFKEESDRRLSGVRSRHARIMSTKQPLLTRIINLKTLVIVASILVVTFYLGRVYFNLW